MIAESQSTHLILLELARVKLLHPFLNLIGFPCQFERENRLVRATVEFAINVTNWTLVVVGNAPLLSSRISL